MQSSVEDQKTDETPPQHDTMQDPRNVNQVEQPSSSPTMPTLSTTSNTPTSVIRRKSSRLSAKQLKQL
jgi:hypothetical protein